MFSSNFLADRPQLVKFLQWFKTNAMYLYLGIIIVTSFFTYFAIGRQDVESKDFCFPKGGPTGNTCFLKGYSQPSSLFWDENYHIASAQRYLHGYFFMEPHPPLGKLIIAIGEKILNPNANLNTEKIALGNNDTDSLPYTKTIDVSFKEGYTPKQGETATFNFTGVRFFPVLAAWLSAILIFILLRLLTKNDHISFLFTLPYIFDNAIIVHSRGAMIDGIQLFFILSALCYFVYIMQRGLLKTKNFVYLGLLVGLAVATKFNGLIIAPFGLILVGKELWELPQSPKQYILRWIQLFSYSGLITGLVYFLSSRLITIETKDKIVDPAVLQFIDKKNFDASLPVYLLSLAVFVVAFRYFSKTLASTKLDSQDWNIITDKFSSWTTKIILFFVMIGAVIGGSYYIHFATLPTLIDSNLATQIATKGTSSNPNDCPEELKNVCKNGNSYPAYIKSNYRQIFENKQTSNPLNFVTQLSDHIYYTNEFQKGVPSYDPTKGENEAGSLPFTWPVGNHPIRYLANKYTTCTTDSKCSTYFSYLYIIANIFVWLMILAGVLLSLALIVSRLFFGLKVVDNAKFWWISLFSGMYVAYMVSMVQISRVMYLYHYILALIFGLIATALVFDYYFQNKPKKYAIATGLIIAIGIITVFVIFAPFTYRFDLTDKEFAFRNWSKYWALMMDWK
jgi:dolichyl-phosphate-mannose--protein O-mannosyl transferase